jgi:hypothetical protein
MKTKSQPNRLGLFDDVRAILDTALTSGGGEFELSSHGQAVHWRQRAYKFRKEYAKILMANDSLSMSPYDRLTMPIIPKDSSTVVIKVREIIGTFTPNREPYSPVEVPVIGDDLLDVAKDIAKKIKGGEL